MNPELFATALIARWKKSGWAHITIYNTASRLRSFCRWADKLSGRIHFTGCVPTMPEPEVRTNHVTQAEAAHAIDTAPPWFRVIMLSCYELGLRSGTAQCLAPEHWNQAEHTILIPSKGKRLVYLPVSPRLEELFSSADAPRGCPFWLAHRGEARLTAERTQDNNQALIALEWARHKKRCRLPEELWLHDLRRSIACHLHTSSGGDLLAVQAALHHKNLRTTLKYLGPLTKDTAKLRTLMQSLWVPKGGPIQ